MLFLACKLLAMGDNYFMKNNNIDQMIKSPSVSGTLNFEQLYVKKEFKAAANWLIQNKQQYSSGIFHYNLGTVYSKMGDYSAARFHLEKAIKMGYINSSSLNNLNFIKSQLQVDDISTSNSVIDQFMNSSLAVPSSAYLSMTLVMMIIVLLLIKSKKLVGKMTIATLLVIALFPLAYSSLYLDSVNYAVAFKETTLYEGPSKIFQEKGKIKSGSKIILGEYRDGWFYVKYPISLAGWASKDQLGQY